MAVTIIQKHGAGDLLHLRFVDSVTKRPVYPFHLIVDRAAFPDTNSLQEIYDLLFGSNPVPADTSTAALRNATVTALRDDVKTEFDKIHSHLNAIKNLLKLAGPGDGTGLPVDPAGFPVEVGWVEVHNDLGASETVTLASVSNGLLVYCIMHTGSISITRVTVGGVGATRVTGSPAVAQGAGGKTIDLWYFKAPPSGSTVLAYTNTGTGNVKVSANLFKNVHQTTPIGTARKLIQTSTTTIPSSITVASVVGGFVIDCFHKGGGQVAPGLGAGQTERYGVGMDEAGSGTYATASTEPGAENVTMSWTVGQNVFTAHMALPILPATS